MRDLALVLFVAPLIPAILVVPYWGVLAWHWISLMSPHQLTYGFANSIPFAMLIGGATILSWLASSREPKRIPWNAVTILLLLLWFWVTVTTVFALVFDRAFDAWTEVSKMLLMVVVTMTMAFGRQRLNQLVWVAALSIGFYGVKGGIWAFMNGFTGRVQGPDGTRIADNNDMALALIMCLPLIRYLQLSAASRWVRLGCLGAFVITIAATISTYSRGGVVGLTIVLGVLLIKSRRGIMLGLASAAILYVVWGVLPAEWFEKMDTISDYENVQSAQSRMFMWEVAVRIAADRPLVGGGFKIFPTAYAFATYYPDGAQVRDVHSMYFEMLGSHGFVGLALFLALLAATLLSLHAVTRQAKQHKELRWARDMASMLTVSIIGYMACGTLLTQAFFDLYYLLIAIVVGLRVTVNEAISPTVPAALPAASEAPADLAPAQRH